MGRRRAATWGKRGRCWSTGTDASRRPTAARLPPATTPFQDAPSTNIHNHITFAAAAPLAACHLPMRPPATVPLTIAASCPRCVVVCNHGRPGLRKAPPHVVAPCHTSHLSLRPARQSHVSRQSHAIQTLEKANMSPCRLRQLPTTHSHLPIVVLNPMLAIQSFDYVSVRAKGQLGVQPQLAVKPIRK